MSNYSEGDIVEIRFRDLQEKDEWVSVESAGKFRLPICKTIGYLLEETSDTVIMAGTVADDNECASVWILPRGCIISIRRIEESELDDFKGENNAL